MQYTIAAVLPSVIGQTAVRPFGMRLCQTTSYLSTRSRHFFSPLRLKADTVRALVHNKSGLNVSESVEQRQRCRAARTALWDSFLAAIKGSAVPADFLVDRTQGERARDPLAGLE